MTDESEKPDELPDCFKVKLLDDSSANIQGGLDALEKQLALIEEQIKSPHFPKTRQFLREKVPEWDIKAMRQLFAKVEAINDKKKPTPSDIVILEGLKDKLTALEARLKKAREVYMEALDIEKPELVTAIMNEGVKAGVLTPEGKFKDAGKYKELEEIALPINHVHQELKGGLINMVFAITMLRTATIPLGLKLDRALSAAQKGEPQVGVTR